MVDRAAGHPARGGRALVVDDNEAMRGLVAARLEECFSVTTVTNGTDAVARFRAEHFDVVFVDVNMPGMDGLEALRLMREIHPNVPVVVLSADLDNET